AATLAEVGAWELSDPRLAALLESYALAYGLDPRDAPASAAVLPYMEQTFGSWYVAGGMRDLARALYERCLARRVEFTFGAEVSALLEKEGRVAGVELADGTAVEADSVVAAVHPSRLSALLPGPDQALPGADEVRRDSPRGRAAGRVTVCLALSGPRDPGAAHSTVVHTTDREDELHGLFGQEGSAARRPTVWVSRPDDPALRPDDDHEAVVLTAAAPPLDGYDWSAPGVADSWADEMTATAGAAIEGLAGRVLWREVRTPANTAAGTGVPAGGMPSPALAGAGGAYLAPANTTRLPGLYFAGGWAHPGGGLAHAGMSGALVAGLIVEGDGFRGSQ
ncbi:MAG TPA: NAD(P)/FAD-dependent oxidoreductase, partial [Streptomyces sp.]|nr:NAD(P)/FAD-dependent oxidoreductase [Streptomyces sp.]